MSSITDICNRALSEIGTQSTISSLAEASPEAEQCSLWYNTMRRRLLRTAPWGFARMQVSLTQLGDAFPDNTSPYPWLWKYAYPPNAIKLRYILPPQAPINNNVAPQVGIGLIGPLGWTPSRTNRFIVAADIDGAGNQIKVLLSNVQGAIGVFTADIYNSDLFDDLFEGALTTSLAYKLCIPLSGNVGMKNDYMKATEDAITQARVADGNEAIPTTDHSVDWIQARGRGEGYGAYGLGRAQEWGQWFGGHDSMNWGA